MKDKTITIFTRSLRGGVDFTSPELVTKTCKFMGNTMLDYSKQILEKVSFDAFLFQKEWGKALRYLVENEVSELEKWVRARFTAEWHPKPIAVLS
jgi:hypothetical protein